MHGCYVFTPHNSKGARGYNTLASAGFFDGDGDGAGERDVREAVLGQGVADALVDFVFNPQEVGGVLEGEGVAGEETVFEVAGGLVGGGADDVVGGGDGGGARCVLHFEEGRGDGEGGVHAHPVGGEGGRCVDDAQFDRRPVPEGDGEPAFHLVADQHGGGLGEVLFEEESLSAVYDEVAPHDELLHLSSAALSRGLMLGLADVDDGDVDAAAP